MINKNSILHIFLRYFSQITKKYSFKKKILKPGQNLGATKWNGTTSEYLQPGRGICQGDPTSPYLFVLCLDKLSYLISYVVDEGEWKAFKFRRQGHVVSYLIFAVDLPLFREATTNHMKSLINILYQFCNMFG